MKKQPFIVLLAILLCASLSACDKPTGTSNLTSDTSTLSSAPSSLASGTLTPTSGPSISSLPPVIKQSFEPKYSFITDLDGDFVNDQFSCITNSDGVMDITMDMGTGNDLSFSVENCYGGGGTLWAMNLDGVGQNEIMLQIDSGATEEWAALM
jgi:hypothetical protein